jgi:D-alanine-D-alanine ligase
VKRRIAILFGGRSAEHEVSVVSARSVMDALDPNRFDAVPIGVTKEGRWQLMPGGPPALPPGSSALLPEVADASGADVALDQEPGSQMLVAEDGSRTPVDVVFPVMHGPFGEDGSIQGLLEMAGVPYVGAGVLASAVGMDKAVQKTLFQAAGIPVVQHQVVHEREWDEDREAVEAGATHLGYPLFVKPATLGSSIGVTKVRGPGELARAVELSLSYGRKVVLERAVEGAREIEVAVLGNDDPVASVAGEVVPRHEFYTYEAKYLDEEGAELIIPAPLEPASMEEAQRLAVGAFAAVDCAGMARVDLFLRQSGDLVVNEINTIPGFTEISMYPKLWEASGLPYRELVERLVDLALERHERERKKGTGR